ncbi:MAG: lipoyl synthase [Deltaproteobacteria bacterium]|nr:lipoyl synthase [Deltaproteobacteria bacterium]
MIDSSSLVQIGARKKPPWISTRLPAGELAQAVRAIVDELHLATVCESSRCPNIGACWSEGTATFMVMGERCTRACRFCHIGRDKRPGPLEVDEPARVAQAVRRLGLAYAVVTSVDRDDLPDHGAAHLAATVRAIHAQTPSTLVELLIPDLGGEEERVACVVEAEPDVVAHNLETIERLTPRVRDRRASYRQSLAVLAAVRAGAPEALVKTGLMLGLGERDEEVLETIQEIAAAGVDVVTFGQYLQPSPRHLPVERYVEPARFDELAAIALAHGLRAVAAGPLVRSSFRARALYAEASAAIMRGRVEGTRG